MQMYKMDIVCKREAIWHPEYQARYKLDNSSRVQGPLGVFWWSGWHNPYSFSPERILNLCSIFSKDNSASYLNTQNWIDKAVTSAECYYSKAGGPRPCFTLCAVTKWQPPGYGSLCTTFMEQAVIVPYPQSPYTLERYLSPHIVYQILRRHRDRPQSHLERS